MSAPIYVQYGCGLSAPRNWRNFDASPTLRFERLPILGRCYTKNRVRFPANVEYGDIVKGLPVRDKSCKAVYCSHVLEHLSLIDFRKALINTHRILMTRGVFRFVLPDLEQEVKGYINSNSHDASINFMRRTYMGKEERKRSTFAIMVELFGNSQHLWMWDYKAIKHELEQANFSGIRKAEYGDNPDFMFRDVEEKERWDGCLGVECAKL